MSCINMDYLEPVLNINSYFKLNSLNTCIRTIYYNNNNN